MRLVFYRCLGHRRGASKPRMVINGRSRRDPSAHCRGGRYREIGRIFYIRSAWFLAGLFLLFIVELAGLAVWYFSTHIMDLPRRTRPSDLVCLGMESCSIHSWNPRVSFARHRCPSTRTEPTSRACHGRRLQKRSKAKRPPAPSSVNGNLVRGQSRRRGSWLR